MALKSTKVIRPRGTRRPSSPTGRALSTAAPSPALKNTSPCNPTYWAHERGLASEKHVIQFYQQRGYEVLSQRLKTPYAEVDLLLRSPAGHVVMVEVKTANVADFHLHRISVRQKQRLLRALLFLTENLGCLVAVHWAFVTKEGAVTLIEDVSG